MKPFFSVIIAVYNRENHIAKAIESLLAQRFQNWEAIIVDDGSNDGTLNVIKEYNSDKRIKIIELPNNKGVASARNKGIEFANGDYLTFLDSDDWYKVNHLQSRYNILNENNIDLLHGGVEIIGKQMVPDKNDTTKDIDLSDCVIGGTFFINISTSESLAHFDNSIQYSEDSDLFDKFVDKGKTIVKTNLKTYVYNRTLDDSICSNQ
jgi:glycosyltransferase involved in cell wall biosynthesis